MFTCTKCGEPLYVADAELKDKILRLDVQCLQGHKSVRRLVERQADEIAEEIFARMFVCLDCGSLMAHLYTETHRGEAEETVLCPIHGPQRRSFPVKYIPAVNEVISEMEPDRAVADSFVCPECGKVFAVREIDERPDYYEMKVRCPNGHRYTRYVAKNASADLLNKILQRVLNCERCTLPGHVEKVEHRGSKIRVHVACPVHGVSRKDLPATLEESFRSAVESIPDDAALRAMLTSLECPQPMAIQRIERDEKGYRFKMLCPATGRSTQSSLPVKWTGSARALVTRSVLTCDECGLLTHLTDKRERRGRVQFKVVCPIHGLMQREVPSDVFEIVTEEAEKIDYFPAIAKTLSCTKCGQPLIVRDIDEHRGMIEMKSECRNGHKNKRFFVSAMNEETYRQIFKMVYQCPECYGPLDLVDIKPAGRESRVTLLCPLHGKVVLEVPPKHAEIMRRTYEDLVQERKVPPIEATEPARPVEIEPSIEEPAPEKGVEVYRGCEIVGGKFDYKVKIVNNSGYVITNVTVSVVAYPEDCLELAGDSVKTISRIEVGGFRSPLFTFYPTKDCVQGKIVSTVSYIDFKDQLHTVQVEPYLIRSVCDLLKPLKATTEQFDKILENLTKTGQEQILDWNARVLFTKAEKILPAKNFHIVDCDERIVAGDFIGTIRGYAEGKYTGKKVAVIVTITGPETGRHAAVRVDALGEDIAMLPTTIDELAESIDSWVCLRCGAPLDPEQVEELLQRRPVRCQYCSHTLTIALYLR
ncbi:MAG: hypothetical protein ACTSPE_06630 [Candidatus Thorarchaeota archaeon]